MHVLTGDSLFEHSNGGLICCLLRLVEATWGGILVDSEALVAHVERLVNNVHMLVGQVDMGVVRLALLVQGRHAWASDTGLDTVVRVHVGSQTAWVRFLMVSLIDLLSSHLSVGLVLVGLHLLTDRLLLVLALFRPVRSGLRDIELVCRIVLE